MPLSRHTKYLQVALNSTLDDAFAVINSLPLSDRILIEAGTPLIKKYGMGSITRLKDWWEARLYEAPARQARLSNSTPQSSSDQAKKSTDKPSTPEAYIVADLKTMDRALTETTEVKIAGASAAVVLGLAPLETLNAFIDSCEKLKMDSMVDMMNVDQPYKILRKLKKLPTVVILHRGVDEESYNKSKPLPYHNIIKVKGSYNLLISVAGGDTSREVQSAVFNGADIVVVWKDFYNITSDTGRLATEFLKEIK